MSFPISRKVVNYQPNVCHFQTTTSVRYLNIYHRSGINFLKTLSVSPLLNPAQNWYQSKNLISRCLEVECSLKERGYSPFYHAAPASSGILVKFTEILYGKKPIRSDFKYLRPPINEFNLSRQQSMRQIPTKREETRKSHLLSTSYSLTSGLRPRESATAFAFANHYGTEIYFEIVNSYLNLLKTSLLSKPTLNYFSKKGLGWIQRAFERKVGDIYIIGLKNLTNVYDSKPYNVPTGRDVKDVMDHPEKYVDTLLPEGTHMATIVINQELNPDEDVIMVTANDPKEVASLKRKKTFPDLNSVPHFREIVSPVETDFERRENLLREELQTALEDLGSQFQEALENPDFIPPNEPELVPPQFSCELLP